MADIFLSYKREDKDRVAPLVQLLEKNGYGVWWDPSIVPGERYASVIRQALDASTCVIVVWSRHSVDSMWVQDEAVVGRDRGILVPICIDDVTPPLGFRQLQMADLTNWSGSTDGAQIGYVLDGVRRHVKAKPAAVQPTGLSMPVLEASQAGIAIERERSRLQAEAQHWDLVRTERSLKGVLDFLATYPNGHYAPAARMLAEKLGSPVKSTYRIWPAALILVFAALIATGGWLAYHNTPLRQRIVDVFSSADAIQVRAMERRRCQLIKAAVSDADPTKKYVPDLESTRKYTLTCRYCECLDEARSQIAAVQETEARFAAACKEEGEEWAMLLKKGNADRAKSFLVHIECPTVKDEMERWIKESDASYLQPRSTLVDKSALPSQGPIIPPAQPLTTADLTCNSREPCRLVKSNLPLRVLPRSQRRMFGEMSESAKPLDIELPAFFPLYVFERHDISYVDPLRPTGWFRVGRGREQPDGFMKAADVLEWFAPIVASFSHRGVEGNERKPVIMFKDRRALEDLIQDVKFAERAADYYKRIETSRPPDEIVAREPDAFADIKKTFYLLPVINHVDLFETMGIEDARILQIAVAPSRSETRSNRKIAPGKLKIVKDDRGAASLQVSLATLVGRATEPPPDITAWVLDKDVTNMNRRAFDVHVLLSRADLDQLTKSLQVLIDAYELNKMTGEGFFKSLQSVVTTAALDVDISKAATLANTNLIPRWIEAMPYKSEITSLKFSDFEEMTADKRQQMQQKLRGLVTLYRQILQRQESWVRLNESMKHEEHVYPMPIDGLP